METISGFLTWENLKSFTGCVAAVGITVQFTKTALDKYIKIPTRLYTYIVALFILVITDILFGPWTAGNFILDIFDAVLVTLSANGAYHLFTESLSTEK